MGPFCNYRSPFCNYRFERHAPITGEGDPDEGYCNAKRGPRDAASLLLWMGRMALRVCPGILKDCPPWPATSTESPSS